MRRGLRYIGVGLVMALALAGCSSGGDDDPEAAAASGGSPTAAESSTEPPPPEPVDPCSLLAADDLEAAGLRPDVDRSVRGLSPDPRTTACMVPDRKDGWSIFYGFSMKPRVLVSDAISQVGTEKPVRLPAGDEARLVLYQAYGDKVWHAWASQDQYAVMVQLFEKPRPAQVDRLLSRMLEGVEPGMLEFPINLPDGCPSPRTRAIQKLLGTVATATGAEADRELTCDYADRHGRKTTLRVSTYKSAQKVASSVRSVAQYYDERSTPARGVTLLVSPGEGYAFAGGYVTRPPSYRGADLQQVTVIGSDYRPLKYDEQAYRALARWWATQS